MTLNIQTIINTLSRNINNASRKGYINNKEVFILSFLEYYKNVSNDLLKDTNKIDFLNKQLKSKPSICKVRIKLPSYINTVTPSVITLTPFIKNISVTTIKDPIYFNSNVLYDSYTFNVNDIEYSDNIDNDYDQLSIDRSDLQDGFLKISFSSNPQDYIIYNEDNSWLTISKNDISKITYFTSSGSDFTHVLNIRTFTEHNGSLIGSNTATLTINRSNLGIGNQPASIGDQAILTNNRVTTTLTLAMFTSTLTPPYSDPENDLIDAIRIDEISAANQGIFYLNNVQIVEGQIITREDLQAGLFTHEGADINTIQSDAFNFSARDEGSQIWIQ